VYPSTFTATVTSPIHGDPGYKQLDRYLHGYAHHRSSRGPNGRLTELPGGGEVLRDPRCVWTTGSEKEDCGGVLGGREQPTTCLQALVSAPETWLPSLTTHKWTLVDEAGPLSGSLAWTTEDEESALDSIFPRDFRSEHGRGNSHHPWMSTDCEMIGKRQTGCTLGTCSRQLSQSHRRTQENAQIDTCWILP